MRKFKISDTVSIQEKNIKNLIETHFGEISTTKENTYVVTNPQHSILEKVNIKINYDDKILLLDIQEKDLSKIQSNGLLSTVPDTVQSKNKFLRNITGTTVEDRKKMLREDVLPTEKAEIRQF